MPHNNTPLVPPIASFNYLEIIPRSLCSSLHLLLAPPVVEPTHPPRSTFPRDLGDEQPPYTWKPRNSGLPSFDTINGEHIKDNFPILYGLVFELHQVVEDL